MTLNEAFHVEALLSETYVNVFRQEKRTVKLNYRKREGTDEDWICEGEEFAEEFETFATRRNVYYGHYFVFARKREGGKDDEFLLFHLFPEEPFVCQKPNILREIDLSGFTATPY